MLNNNRCNIAVGSSAAPSNVARPGPILSVPIEKSKTGKRTSKNPKMLPNFHNPSPKEPFTMKLGERKINKKSIAPKVIKKLLVIEGR
jgi:hypothetical protein